MNLTLKTIISYESLGFVWTQNEWTAVKVLEIGFNNLLLFRMQSQKSDTDLRNDC